MTTKPPSIDRIEEPEVRHTLRAPEPLIVPPLVSSDLTPAKASQIAAQALEHLDAVLLTIEFKTCQPLAYIDFEDSPQMLAYDDLIRSTR